MEIIDMLSSVREYLFSVKGQLSEKDEKIINAMKKVKRINFVPEQHKKYAYIDRALPIDCNQTISQPSTVARMLSLLDLNQEDGVLEIGTGSSWNAALISCLIKKGNITTIEISKELAEEAKEKLNSLGFKNIKTKQGDFRLLNEKFDKIIFTAGIKKGQEKQIENYSKSHLNENGILLCPFQTGPLIIIKKKFGKIEKSYTKENYVFVPLI